MTLLNAIKRLGAQLLGAAPEGRRPTDSAVGQGAPNETQITIADLPHLFRDEGDSIVHFVAAFEHRVTETRFGQKLLPEVVPRWNKQAVIRGSTVEQAISEALSRTRSSPSAAPHPVPTSPATRVKERVAGADHVDDARQPSTPQPSEVPAARSIAGSKSSTVGRLAFWGEMKFPKRGSAPPKFYTSFAIRVDTGAAAEVTLQGEGLKDAIAEAKCTLGDHVRVTRLEKVKVPAFHERSGKPMLDNDGNQKLWDKWLWRIDKIH
ncbi:hypothetical protein [Cupriavidus sp. WS]|uniref:hypothetical protein n=1 Tax=Cupriavidus sp. WS TaxID=1312922 RepID=UPI0005BD033B|nr:hypothetical protein [Cupriavidus sp. WS]